MNLPGAIFNDIAQQRSPLLTGVTYSPDPCASTQSHHLIPQKIWLGNPQLLQSPGLQALGGMDSPLNLMELPATLAGAQASQLALHNGSHPGYTIIVEEKIREILETHAIMSTTQGAGMADAALVTAITDLQEKMRSTLDRSMGGQQLSLTSKDPYFVFTSLEHQAATLSMEQLVDNLNASPASGFPTSARAREACEAQMEPLTVEQLQAAARKLREAAWANVPEHLRPENNGGRILAQDKMEDLLTAQAAIRPAPAASAALPTAAPPSDGGLSDYLPDNKILAAALVSTAAIGAIAYYGSGLGVLTTIAVGGFVLLNPSEAGAAIPPASAMNRGSDDMGSRNDVDHISWRFSGIKAGDAGNNPEALYARDTAASREGGPLQHAQGHLILKADGSLMRSEQFNRPWDTNPQIEGGNNGNAIGIIVEGTDKLTDAQRATLTTLNAKLGEQRGVESELSPAGLQEQMAWDGNNPSSNMGIQPPAQRLRAGIGIGAGGM